MVRTLSLRIFIFVIGVLISMNVIAQESVEMADTFRSNGKIYIVVAVCLTILTGLFLYVLRIDKKISRLEKRGVE